MKHIYMRKLKFGLVFTAFIIFSISKVYAQRADAVPIVKYLINNYASISRGICDTCEPILGKPLQRYRPIPFPPTGIINLIPGVDINQIPGLSAPNFLGGGSPEIKGLVKEVAGMTDTYAKRVRTSDILYFRTGARGVAVSHTGKIFTSSSTFLPGADFENPLNAHEGFFSFKSEPARLSSFNSRSQETFVKSPNVLYSDGDSIPNGNKEIAYFALHPTNENIVYAALKNTENDTKILARKNRNGNWEKLDWDIVVGLADLVWGALTVDKEGNLYVADAAHHVIVKVTFDEYHGKANSWQIIAGKMDTPGFANDDDALDARFNKPSGICIDNAGNIYVGDAGNNRIRKIDEDGVTTYAGNGDKGFEDDEDWNDAKFWGPTALAYNERTKALYVVDFENKLIREIDENRRVSTLAGNVGSVNPITEPERFAMGFYYQLANLNMDPDEAKFSNPTGIAIEPTGFGIYVSDGQYIKYVSTFKALFEITASYRSPDAKINLYGAPILPPGIIMNPNNGAFFGASAVPWEPTTYAITATNSTGKSIINGFVAFEVVDCPEIPDSVSISTTISPKQIPYTWHGQVLSGSGTAYTTLESSGGCDSVVVLNLVVRPEFNYNCDPYLLSLGQAINPIVPATSGSTMNSFSVSPPLPAGLILNAQTGTISGTPTAYATSQLFASIGPSTPRQYPAPWTLEAGRGADITQVQISDCNHKIYFENNTSFKSLQGSAGPGSGTAGAYSDFSGLGPIKMSTNTPYSIRLSNTLSGGNVSSLNTGLPQANYMNSYAVYIDYNRDGDFADAGERVYRSAAPQRDAHAEVFNLNIPATATSGVTKMRIYAVEAATWLSYFNFRGSDGWLYNITRTTEQALSFYPFFNDISYTGEQDFSFEMDYGEFEDYNLEIENPLTQSYVIKGRNSTDSAEAIVKISVNDPTRSTTNATICSTELPYYWNNLIVTQSGTQTDTLKNRFGADSLATLNLVVKQATRSEIAVAHCGTYLFNGQELTESGFYGAKIPNAAGCDSTIFLTFRQKATASQTNVDIIPSLLPYYWNGLEFKSSGTQSAPPFKNQEGCDSTATLTVRVQYNIYYTTSNLLEINKPIQAIRPQIEGNYIPTGIWYNSNYGYNISPSLPNGLYLDGVTGVISGTPTQLSPLQTYTVTLRQDGAQPATFTLSVGAPSFSTTTIENCGPLTWNGVVYDKAGTATFVSKNQYGFDSTATLVLSIRNLSASTTNLNLNLSDLPVIWNGDSITREGLHTVHLVNMVGCDSAATANVVISPKIVYDSPQILQPNQPMTAIIPQNLGGKVLNYTITPSLVRGLQFDALTGTISGTPADTLPQPVTHTVQAVNRAGTDSTKLVVAVCNPMATSFTMNTCDRYVWNDSIYTESTTHIRTLKNRGGCDSVVTMNLIIRKASQGLTDNITACANYVWYGVKYDTTGIYTKVYPNTVGCDSTIYLNLTIKYPTVNNLYVNLNASDLPYTWRGKTFSVPGTDSVMKVNNVGCDSTIWMTVRISDLLPDISYAVTDTVLHWEKSIQTPIAMSNTGTPIPTLKLGESDTLIKFANAGPGDHIRNTVKGRDGAYYSRVHNNSTVWKLSPSGEWTSFVNAGSAIHGLAIDTSGNLYVALNSYNDQIKKITPDGVISDLPGSPRFFGADNVFVDGNNTLFILEANNYTQLDIVKYNLSTGEQVKTKHDNSPYFQFGPEDMKVDSKGNIYIYKNSDNVVVKIRPNGRMSGIGRKGSDYSVFKPGNGPDATLPTISSIAIDPTNDNLYIMAGQQLLRVDTAENVTAISGKSFDYWYQIFRVDSGKVSVINNTKGRLFTSNVYGVGSLPFMDNYGGDEFPYNGPKTDYTNFDRRIRLDSSGAIVGTPRSAQYEPGGPLYASSTTTGYTIVGANQHGVSTAPMVITVKQIIYKREHFVTTSFPFVWKGRSFIAATDTATYFGANKTMGDDTLYMLHLVYEGPPEPVITSTCVEGGVSLTATGAARSSIKFDGTNFGKINYLQTGGGVLGYFNGNSYRKTDNTWAFNFSMAFEVWIKPTTVSGTQYILTRDTVKTNGTFFGLSVQDGKFVYEFRKGNSLPFTDHILRSNSSIEANVWTHVAASFYDSTMYIFVNGKLEGMWQTPDGSWFGHYPDSARPINLSSDLFLAGLGTKNGFKGEMDELRLWATRRNADSIKATMNTIVSPSSAGLGLYYRFDGDVSGGAMDISSSGRRARFIKPAISVPASMAPVNFASYQWMPGGNTAKSIVANPTSNTLYTLTVKDYKGTPGSNSLLVFPAQGPTITAPAAVARTNSPSSCTVLISDSNLGSAVATDNCTGVTVKRTGVPAGNLFSVGVTTITYTATNAAGLTKTATQKVTVTDISKPAFTTNLAANPMVIWPPDRKLKNVALIYTTADNCGKVTNKITVTSTDPITGVHNGGKSPDWIVTNDHLVQLRAERGNGKEERIYTITVTPVDGAGNVGTPQSTNVIIAHNITGPITGASFKIGSTVNFSGVFWDKQGNKHTGEWLIDDNTVVKGKVTEPFGAKNGKLTGSYKFNTAGTYKLRMNITDQNKVTSYCNTNEDMEAIVVIYDPAGGYSYGGGWFASPAGALKSNATATGKASFGYAVSYFKGASKPKGETQFEFKVGNLEFNALNFEYLSIGGARAQIKGAGKITGGQSGINFIMTVIDGALDRTGIDKIRIKIFNKNSGQVYYDNEQGSDASNPVTKVGTNSQIVIGGTSVTTNSSAAIATRATTHVAPTDGAAILQAQAFPNPSRIYFTLIVKGKNNEPVTLRVSDVLGRLVEVRTGLPANGTLSLGTSYRPGVYIAEVLQGKEKVMLKLIKQ